MKVRSEPERIVVIAPNWLGDAIMALPALGDVRRRWPDARLEVAARAPLVPAFRCVPGVDEVVTLMSGGGVRALPQASADARRLQEGNYDVALLLPNSFHAAWLIRRAGIPERWGYRSDLRGRLLTRSVARPRGRRHQAEYYQHLTAALGIPSGALKPELRVPDEAVDAGRRLLEAHGWKGEPLMGVAPGAAYGWAKRWPPSYFGSLAAYVIRDLDLRPVLVGASADRDTAREVRAGSAARLGEDEARAVIDVVGETDLMTFAGVVVHCAAFVANDSGAMHLAGALGVPVTAIFGPTREWATSPLHPAGRPQPRILTSDVWCRPCMLRYCPIDHRCMTRIAPEDVLGSVAAQLGEVRPGPGWGPAR
jgi:heptosyltransferase-2